jgi:hypothetical protein
MIRTDGLADQHSSKERIALDVHNRTGVSGLRSPDVTALLSFQVKNNTGFSGEQI